MISASVPESEPILKLLLQKGADVNEKSRPPPQTVSKERKKNQKPKYPKS